MIPNEGDINQVLAVDIVVVNLDAITPTAVQHRVHHFPIENWFVYDKEILDVCSGWANGYGNLPQPGNWLVL